MQYPDRFRSLLSSVKIRLLNNMTHSHSLRTGFTLIEVVAIIAITSLMLGGLVNMYLAFQNLYGLELAYSNTAGSASQTLNLLRPTIAVADKVVSSRTISGTSYTTNTTTVILELPSIDAGGAVINNSKDYVVVTLSGKNLLMITSSASGSARASGTKQLSSAVQTLSFSYDNTDPTLATGVSIDLSSQATYKSLAAQNHIQETVYLRNAP